MSAPGTSPKVAARVFEGLSVFTHDGKPARLAILDEDGKVIAEGKNVADAAYHTSVEAYRQMLEDKGHIRVYTHTEALAMNTR